MPQNNTPQPPINKHVGWIRVLAIILPYLFIVAIFQLIDQYLGFLAFLTILTIGFWLMIFLLTFVIPYWVGGSFIEFMKEKREERKLKREQENS